MKINYFYLASILFLVHAMLYLYFALAYPSGLATGCGSGDWISLAVYAIYLIFSIVYILFGYRSYKRDQVKLGGVLFMVVGSLATAGYFFVIITRIIFGFCHMSG